MLPLLPPSYARARRRYQLLGAILPSQMVAAMSIDICSAFSRHAAGTREVIAAFRCTRPIFRTRVGFRTHQTLLSQFTKYYSPDPKADLPQALLLDTQPALSSLSSLSEFLRQETFQGKTQTPSVNPPINPPNRTTTATTSYADTV